MLWFLLLVPAMILSWSTTHWMRFISHIPFDGLGPSRPMVKKSDQLPVDGCELRQQLVDRLFQYNRSVLHLCFVITLNRFQLLQGFATILSVSFDGGNGKAGWLPWSEPARFSGRHGWPWQGSFGSHWWNTGRERRQGPSGPSIGLLGWHGCSTDGVQMAGISSAALTLTLQVISSYHPYHVSK